MWSNRLSPLSHYSTLPGKSQSLYNRIPVSRESIGMLVPALRNMSWLDTSSIFLTCPHMVAPSLSLPNQARRKDPIITTDLHLLAISGSIQTTIRNVKIHHRPNGLNESFPYRESTGLSHGQLLLHPTDQPQPTLSREAEGAVRLDLRKDWTLEANCLFIVITIPGTPHRQQEHSQNCFHLKITFRGSLLSLFIFQYFWRTT